MTDPTDEQRPVASEGLVPSERFSHIDETGRVRMVDVSQKPPTERVATASAVISMTPHALDQLLSGTLVKGEALPTAKIAAIQAAKKTGELIPLCHPLGLDWITIEFTRTGPGTLRTLATAKTTARTGVEMEALTAASVAALTLYDMVKAIDRSMVIGPIQLESKTGGRKGPYQRESTAETDPD